MTEPTRQAPRRFRRLGAVIAIVTVTLVILAGGAFAVSRNTGPHPAPQSAYSQTTGSHHGPMQRHLMRHHWNGPYGGSNFYRGGCRQPN